VEVLSHTIQFLSELDTFGPTFTGLSQVKPPSVERLTTTAAVVVVFEIGNEAMIHTPCLASKATAGSLAAS